MNFYRNLNDLERVLKLMHSRQVVNWVSFLTAICAEALEDHKKIMICGNGGSHCDAEHFVEELTGRLYQDGDPIRALNASLSPGHITCTANDMGYEKIFQRGVACFAEPGDILICLSTSGKSPNVLAAAKEGHLRHMEVFLLTGQQQPDLEIFGGTRVVPWLDGEIPDYLCIQSADSARIQEAHKLILHSVAQGIEERLR